jgi:drug/metabolite transporter (DMT)-like permease
MKRHTTLKYEFLLLLLSALWGGAFAAQQIGMQKGLSPMTFNALRFALGTLTLVPVVLWRAHHSPSAQLPLSKDAMKWTFWAGVFLFSASALQQMGLQYTSSANSGFITSLYVVFVPLIGLRFKQATSKSLWLGIAICLVGLYLLSIKRGFTLSRGDGLTLACAVLWACQILAIGHVAGKGDSIRIAWLQFGVCTILSSLAALVFETVPSGAITAAMGAITYAGIGSVAIAFTLQVVCQKRCPPAPAAVIMSTEAVFAALAGYLVLGQTLSLREGIGCGFILSGVLVVQCIPFLAARRQ